MLIQVKVEYLYFGEKHDYYFDMTARDENEAMHVVKKTLEENKFFHTDKELIAVVEIRNVSFSPVLDGKKE